MHVMLKKNSENMIEKLCNEFANTCNSKVKPKIKNITMNPKKWRLGLLVVCSRKQKLFRT